jgi:hypothetical protein
MNCGFLFSLFALFVIAGPVAAPTFGDEQPPETQVHAFSVAKETNPNYVSYQVRLAPGCRIDTKDPIEMHWVTPTKDGGTRKDSLNLVENRLYGMDVDKSDPGSLEGEIKAVKDRGLKLTVRVTAGKSAHGCSVRTVVFGDKLPRPVVVSSLYLQHFSGQRPAQIAVSGRDSATGRPAHYVLNLA